jgi:predicted outer membrane repeat protein
VVVRLFSGDEALENGGAILVDSGGTIKRIRPATA